MWYDMIHRPKTEERTEHTLSWDAPGGLLSKAVTLRAQHEEIGVDTMAYKGTKARVTTSGYAWRDERRQRTYFTLVVRA
jgi:hypothetical protein